MPVPDMNSTDAEWLRNLQEAIACNDEQAFEKLFRLYKDRVYHVALTFTASTILAEEILQDIFVQVWMQRSTLPAIEDFNDWLFIVTRNRSFNTLRGVARAGARERKMVDHLPLTEETADRKLLTADIERLVTEGMQLLTPSQQKAFELSKLKGYSREQTAEIMGISANTVKVHLLHASRTVRAYVLANFNYTPTVLFVMLLF